MITTVEGIYKQGKVELLEIPPGVQESHVLVTFLPQSTGSASRRRMIYGQFAGKQMSTEEDFRLAEWRGEDDDGN
jgi:hypothetical protein